MENDRNFPRPAITDFHGAKLFLFAEGKVVTLLRDDIPNIPDPGRWDFPGGGREGDETAQTCVLRELKEELNLSLPPSALIWSQGYHSVVGTSVFFAAHIAADRVDEIRLGGEGQAWALMSPEAYLRHPRNIARFAQRLRDYLNVAQAAEF